MKTLSANQKINKKDFSNFEVLTNQELNVIAGGYQVPSQPSGGPDDWGLPKRKIDCN